MEKLQNLRETVRQQFLNLDDFEAFVKASDEFGKILFDSRKLSNEFPGELSYSRFQGAVAALGPRDLCNNTERCLWFMKRLMTHTRQEGTYTLVAADHYWYGTACMRHATTLDSKKLKQASNNLCDETFKHYKKVIELGETIPLEGVLDCYAFLSYETFERKLYQDHIRYAEKEILLNRKLGEWEEADYFKVFKTQNKLAQSYYHCGFFDKAIETYKQVLANHERHPDVVKPITLDELYVLFSLYLSATDEETSLLLEALVKKAQPYLDASVMRSIRAERAHTTKQANNKKASGKKKGTNQDELRQYMRKRFIADQIGQMDDLCGRMRNLDSDRYGKLVQEYGLDQVMLNRMLELTTFSKELSVHAGKFKGTSEPKDVKDVLALHNQMKESYSQLMQLQRDLKDQVSAQIKLRKQPAQRLPEDHTGSKAVNLKTEVMKAHEQHAPKTKTSGVADPAYAAVEKKTEKEPEVVNSIVSAVGDAEVIFDTQQAWNYPANAVECLNVLNRSRDIHELRENLKGRDARLKQLSGRNAGTWQFRVNKQYRIRFELTEGGFTNVQFGDFH